MDTSTNSPQKQGLGTLAWVGIGCGSLVLIGIIVIAGAAMFFGPKAKKLAEDMQANPTKTSANMMVTVSAGQMEMVAEDDVNKRYTVRQKATGKLTTIYFNKKTQAPEVIEGDFSAIPPETVPVVEPVPAPN